MDKVQKKTIRLILIHHHQNPTEIILGWGIGPSFCVYLQRPRLYSVDGGSVNPWILPTEAKDILLGLGIGQSLDTTYRGQGYILFR
jgi:hypothetical protein